MRELAPHPVSEESTTLYGKDWFDIFDLKRIERDRRRLLEGIGRHEEFIKAPDDRVGYIWALKRMAEDIEHLDKLDRIEEGYLPISSRPPLMLRLEEVELLLQVLAEYAKADASPKVQSLSKKVKAYADR
jgi:hypothetical protein